MRGRNTISELKTIATVALAIVFISGAALAEVGAYLEKPVAAPVQPTTPAEVKPASPTPTAPAAATPAPATPSTPAATPTSPVGGSTDPDFLEDPTLVQSTLKLVGDGCEINTVESAVLRLPGVVGVDTETKKGHLIVSYSNAKVKPEQMGSAITRRVRDFEGKRDGKRKANGYGIMALPGLNTKGCNVLLVK